MASNDDLTEQLELTKKITAQMQQMAAAAERLAGAFSSQAQTVEKIASNFSKIDTSQAAGGVASLSKTLATLDDSAQKTDKEFKTLFDHMAKKAEDLGKIFKDKFAKEIFVATAALKGMQQGIKTVVAIGQGLTSFLLSVVDGLVNVAVSIIAIPFKMLQGLIDMGAKAFTGMSELAQAMEDLRKQFGAFSTPTNKAIIETSKNMKGIQETGLSAWRVFGTMAERLKYTGELAKEMGGAFTALSKEFTKNGEAIMLMQKGLGIANEDMKQLERNAVSNGTSMADVEKDMTKYSTEMGKAFKAQGIDAKVISREIAQASTDVKHFGGASIKQMAEASTYAHGLGLELKDITGTLDKFDTFDQAAENAAKLGQAFGVNLDAFKLMNAQDPADQVDQMRKAFRAAGKDASTMGRAELKLLAQTTGLDEGVAKAAFSMKNQGISLDEIKKKSGDASKKTLTQQQAMVKLSDAIERLVKAGQEMKGGFFETFFDGIKRGMMSSKEFYGMMMNIHMALQQVMMVGVRLGRELMRIVPGFHEIFGGFSDFFQPSNFVKMFEGISDAVKRFFDPSSPDKGSVPNLAKNLQDVILDMFTREGTAGKKILDGFKKFFEMAAKFAGDAMVWLSDNIADGIQYVIELLNGTKSLNAPGLGGGMGFLSKIITPLVEGLSHAWTVLSPALWKLVVTLGDKLVEFIKKPEIWDKVKMVLYGIGATILIPALVRGMAAQIGVLMMKEGVKMFTGPTEAAAKTAATSIAKHSPAGRDLSGMKEIDLGSISKQAEGAAKLEKAGGNINWAKITTALIGLAGVLAIGMTALFIAIIAIRKFKISQEEILKSLEIVGGASLAMVPAAAAIKILSLAGKGVDFESAAIGILAMAGGIVAMVGTIGAINLVLSKTDVSNMMGVTKLIMEISKVFLLSGPIVIEAMAIGLLMAGTEGIAAIAAAAGFATMGVAIAAMAASIYGIMKALNDIPAGEGLESKVKMFTMIMDSLTNFSKNLTVIISSVTPSWMSIIRGKDDTTERLKSLTEFLKTYIGEPNGSGMIGLVEVIVYAVQSLANGNEKTLESAKIFAELMTAVTSMATAMKPSDEFFKSINGLWTTAGDVNDGLKKLTEHSENIASGLKSVLGVITKDIMPLVTTGFSKEQLNGVQAIAGMLDGVAKMAQALNPSPATLNMLRDTIGGTIGRDDQVLNPENMKLLGTFVTTMSASLKELLPPVIWAFTPLLEAIGKWTFTPGQIEALKIVGPILQSLVEIARAVTISAAQLAIAHIPADAIQAFLDQVVGTMPKVFDSISAALPKLINGLKDALVAMGGMKTADITKLKSIFTFMSDVTSIVKNTLSSSATNGTIDARAWLGGISTLTAFVFSLTTQDAASGGIPGEGGRLGLLMRGIDEVGRVLASFNTGNATKTVMSMNTVFSSVSDMGSNFNKMTSTVLSATTGIRDNGVLPALEAVQKMVDTVNKLNAALSDGNLNKIDVKTKLENVAKSVGLGASGQYNVKNGEVNITVNLQVTMDATKVESAILSAKSSIIADRLNYVTSTVPGATPISSDKPPIYHNPGTQS